MASYKDQNTCFAPLEIIERMIEIREEMGFAPTVYLPSSFAIADFLDAYGFDVYAFSNEKAAINYGDYRAPMVPGGDFVHCSITAH